MLKNLMEEKQLDFNQPLLSVRRFSATMASSETDDKRKSDQSLPKPPPLPVYKSELKSGPVRNPGTVPFIWEQIPGRPKDESKSCKQALERPSTTPKLPPGRVSNVKKQVSNKGSRRTTASQSQTGNVLSHSQNVSTLDRKKVTKYDSSKDGMEDKRITGSEDGDETYLDALDALSRTESSYMNCSVSGLSGLDGPDNIPSDTFSADLQTRDFMMGRFLPAAKAMASETPQYATRKQPVAREQQVSQEQSRGMYKVVTGDKQHPLNQYRSNDFPHYGQYTAGGKSKDEGRRVQVQSSISSVRRVHAKYSYLSSDSETKNEHSGSDACEQRLMTGHQEAGVSLDKTDLNPESNQIMNQSDCQKLGGLSVYRRQQGAGISPYRNESIFHEEKGFLGIPKKSQNSRETKSSDKYRKGHNNFHEILATENVECDSGSPVIEKTLYIDSVHTVKSPSSNLRSLDTKCLIDYRGNDFEIPEKSNEVEETTLAESSFQDIEHLGDVHEKALVRPKSLELPDFSFLSCSDMRNGPMQDQDLVQDSRKLESSKVADLEKNYLESQQFKKSGEREKFDGLIQDCATMESAKLATKSGAEESSNGHGENSIALTSSKVANKGKIDLESHRLVKFGNQDSSQGYSSGLPRGPPLPKSPSESWLKRTLPTISSRSSSSQSSIGSQVYTSSQASKTSSLDPKWETIVKTSNTHHGRLRFSEELLTPIPEA